MDKKIKLFCIPYAGGSADIYLKWKPLLNNSIELIPIELPGRGRRVAKPLITDFQELIEDLKVNVKKHINKEDKCAFFGHSMGTILALELSYMVRDTIDNNCLKHIFFSGRYPAHIKKSFIRKSQLPYEDFKAEVLKYKGTPIEIFENKELSRYYLPILRSDYSIIETYNHVDKEKNPPFNCNVTVLSGKEDEDIHSDDLIEWGKYTNSEFQIHYFEGGHFFINEQTHKIVDIINSSIAL